MSKLNISQLAREHGLKPRTVLKRIKVQGMSLEQALNEPVKSFFQRAWENEPDKMMTLIRTPKLLTWLLTNPEGKEVEITDLPKFCQEMKWKRDNLDYYIKRGVPYRGWTIRKKTDVDATQENAS